MQSTKILIPKNQLTDLNKGKGPNKKSVNEFTTKVKEVEMNTPDNLIAAKSKNEVEAPYLHYDSVTIDNNNNSKQKINSVRKPFSKLSSADSGQNIRLKKSEMNRTLSGKKWYLDLYASPDLPLNDQAAYIPNYQLDEKMKISYSIGLKINR